MPNNTLHNGFHLLEAMARNPKPWSVAELSVALDLPRSHVHRLLTSLTELGYLHRPPRSRLYQVDVKLFELASALAAEHPLRRLSGAALRRLADRTRGSAYLIVWQNEAPMILAVDHHGGKRLGTTLEVGKRLGLHATASGKLFMALLGVGPRAGELEPVTAATITDPTALLHELAVIRARQISISRKEASAEIVAYALPVYDRENALVAAIGLVVPADAARPADDPRWVAACADAARNLSAALGYTGLYPVDPDDPQTALNQTAPLPISTGVTSSTPPETLS